MPLTHLSFAEITAQKETQKKSKSVKGSIRLTNDAVKSEAIELF